MLDQLDTLLHECMKPLPSLSAVSSVKSQLCFILRLANRVRFRGERCFYSGLSCVGQVRERLLLSEPAVTAAQNVRLSRRKCGKTNRFHGESVCDENTWWSELMWWAFTFEFSLSDMINCEVVGKKDEIANQIGHSLARALCSRWALAVRGVDANFKYVRRSLYSAFSVMLGRLYLVRVWSVGFEFSSDSAYESSPGALIAKANRFQGKWVCRHRCDGSMR